MGKGALAFIAGLGTGYLNQRNREEEKARQDKFDQIALDRAEDEKSERDRKKKILADVASAAQDGSAVEIQDKSIQPQQSVIGANGIAGAGGSQNQDATSTTPIAAQGILKSTWQVGGKSFSDADSANKAVQEYNAPEARNARIAQVYRANGDHATALELEAKAKQASLVDFQTKVEQRKYARSLQQEGVFDAAAALRRGDAESIKKAFNESGQHKIEGDVVVSPVERDIPGVGKKTTYQATFNVIGPDGKPKQVSYNSHDLSMQLMPAEKALDWDHTIFKEKNRQDQWKQEFDHKKKIDSVNTGISAGHLALSRERENRQTLVGQLQDKERALGRKLSEDERNNLLGVDTMPQAIKMQVSSLLKEQEQISQALNKAQADDSFVATDKEGKPNPLIVRSASLNMQLEKLLNYKNKTNDPLGIMSPNPQAPPIASQVGIANKPQVSSDAAVKKMPPPLASKGILSPAVDGIDLRGDPVLSSLKQQLSLLDINDPANMNKIMALGKAKNERLEQLQDKHGRLTKLIVE